MQRGFRFRPPSILPAAAETCASLAISALFGGVCAAGLQGRIPEPFAELRIVDAPALRALFIAIGFSIGLLAVVGAGSAAGRTWSRLAHGWHLVPEHESVGPFRIVEGDSGAWRLQLGFDSRTPAMPSRALFFRLDEGTVGAMSRVFDPDETLYARWVDLPMEGDVPLLLQVCPPAEMTALSAPTVVVPLELIEGSFSPLRRAA